MNETIKFWKIVNESGLDNYISSESVKKQFYEYTMHFSHVYQSDENQPPNITVILNQGKN